MDTVPLTPNLSMLRINGWQMYVWRDDDSVTLIDTGEPIASDAGDRIREVAATLIA